jgi:NitT/TauT family transport system substrate-binding protein
MRNAQSRTRRAVAGSAALALGALALTACGGSSASSGDELRLGYFPNLTHASALIGVKQGYLQKALGATKLTTQTFNAGTSAVEALNAGAIDATYIGPNPAINAFAQSNGESIRIISGATSGGAAFVVQPAINNAQDLRGKVVNSPQLGNTQDVALRYWLDGEGLKTSVTGKGDVEVQSTENSTILQLFQDRKIAGAWVPEPWVSRLITEGGGKVLVDEATLWPRGEFVTTQLIVRTQYLKDHPAQVKALLEGHVAANTWIDANPDAAKADVNAELLALTGQSLKPAALDRAWNQITVTNDPIASSLLTSAKHAVAVGVTKDADLRGIYDLTLLNQILVADSKTKVSDAGYGPPATQ